MLDVLLHSPRFAAFLLASVVLALTPGPGVIYLLTQTMSRGRQSGLLSVAGLALGSLANAVLASLGLAVVMATSATAFSLVKFAGAAYLAYLAIKTLRAPPDSQQAAAPVREIPLRRVFRDGFFVAIAMITDTLYVCTAAALAGRIRRAARLRGVSRYLSAATFLGLAAYAAFAHPRTAR
jgi:threonine/homoserine/homoserine lactone efflux protein